MGFNSALKGLIYHNAQNEKYVQYWGFCECGNDPQKIRKRRVTHSITRPQTGLQLCETRLSHTDVDWWRVTGVSVEHRSAFILDCWPWRWKGNWIVDRARRLRWIFTNTAVRISPPPTVVPKRRQETTNRRCVKPPKSADLIYTGFEAQNHATVEVLRFLLLASQENA